MKLLEISKLRCVGFYMKPIDNYTLLGGLIHRLLDTITLNRTVGQINLVFFTSSITDFLEDYYTWEAHVNTNKDE
jgi:hypothetical protein